MAKWIVAWDFVKRPKRLFYNLLACEFASEVQLLQKSVAMCTDDFTARRLRALAEAYGGNVLAYAVNGHVLDDPEGDREARAYIERLHQMRRARQGKRTAVR